MAPSRTEGGQRLYSDEDVRRLSLLHQVVEEGRSISQVAPPATEELQWLVREGETERRSVSRPEALGGPWAERILERAEGAVDKMEPVCLSPDLPADVQLVLGGATVSGDPGVWEMDGVEVLAEFSGIEG